MKKQEAIKKLFFDEFNQFKENVQDIKINEDTNEIKVKLKAGETKVSFEITYFEKDILNVMDGKKE